MKGLINELYELIDLNPDKMNLYDLFYLLRKPCKIRFTYARDSYDIESVLEGENINIYFNNHHYPSIDEFFRKAEIDGALLTTIYRDFYDFKLISTSKKNAHLPN